MAQSPPRSRSRKSSQNGSKQEASESPSTSRSSGSGGRRATRSSSRSGTSRQASSSGARRSSQSGSQNRSRRSQAQGSDRDQRQSRSRGGPSTTDTATSKVGSAAQKARGPLIAVGGAAAAVAGGVLLQRQLKPKHKILGLSMPTPKLPSPKLPSPKVPTPKLDGVSPAGKFALKPVAKRVERVGKRAENTGDMLSKWSKGAYRLGKTVQKVSDTIS